MRGRPLHIDIVIPRIEISGTTKYMSYLARGFAELGHSVRILFGSEGPQSDLVVTLFDDLPRVRYAGKLTDYLSRLLIGEPLLRLFAEEEFASDQSINVIGSAIGAKSFAKATRDSDLVVYANFWGFPPLRFLQQRTTPEVVFFHEDIGARFLPSLLRDVMQTYCRLVARATTLSVAITDQIALMLSHQGVASKSIAPGFIQNLQSGPKQSFVLVDSRWLKSRQPFRIIEVAKRVPSGRFLMVGRFPDLEVRNRLIQALKHTGLDYRVEIVGPLSEAALLELYSQARCMARWAEVENGIAFSLVYAISCGVVPVMSKNLGGAAHLAKEVSPDLACGSDDELAAVINRLLTDEQFYQERQRQVLAWRDRRPWSAVAADVLQSVANAGE